MIFETQQQQQLQQASQQQEQKQQKQYAQIEDYRIIKKLGEGANAKVKLAQKGQSNTQVALKLFKANQLGQQQLAALAKECQIMQKLQHPNIIQLFDIKPQAIYYKKNGSQYPTMLLALELAKGGELFDFIAEAGTFTEPVARTYFRQLLDGLEFMHKQNICHRDLKPENLLLDEKFNLKIADFGFSTQLQKQDGSKQLHTVLGTPGYQAPEILLNKPYEGDKVDIFAAAVILFIMVSGHPPFSQANQKDGFYKFLMQAKFDNFWKYHSQNKPGKDKYYSPNLQNFISALLQFDPSFRPSIAQMKSHPWLSEASVPSEKILEEFLKRQQIVKKNLEQQKQAQKQQKQQQAAQNNAPVTGFAFRGREGKEDMKDLIDGIKQKYNLDKLNLQIRKIDQSQLDEKCFITPVDGEYLYHNLLLNYNKFYDEIFLCDDGSYKIICKKTNVINQGNMGDYTWKQDVKFSIEFLKVDEENCYVKFDKIEGQQLDFFNATKKFKDYVLEL